MNLYETVKGRVTPQMAAERYDLPVNRSGMAPFLSIGFATFYVLEVVR